MKTLHFSTIVNAKRDAVWNAMLAPQIYKAKLTAICEAGPDAVK
jgi:hypothetical protein